MNLEEVYSQINKEADEVALVWPWGYSQTDADNLVKPQPAMQINAIRRLFYIKGATPYAEKWYDSEQEVRKLKQWREEAGSLLNPLLEWGQAQKDMPLGCSITKEILLRAALFSKYEKALREIKKGLNWIENSRELDIIHETLTHKTSTDDTDNG